MMDIQSTLDDRSDRDTFLRDHYASPLPDEDRESFSGLDYFPPDTSWVLSGEYEEIDPHDVQIPSTAGMDNPYAKVGEITIALGDVVYRLTVIDDGDGGAFVPFRDGTCGAESYAGGRYVGISAESSGTISVDFNDARNPWCVYDEEFICPLPPAENWIEERVPAGEMMYRPTA